MFTVYRPAPGRRLIPFAGPADLHGYAGPLVVEGGPTPAEAARWAIPLGLAVTRGATITRRYP